MARYCNYIKENSTVIKKKGIRGIFHLLIGDNFYSNQLIITNKIL